MSDRFSKTAGYGSHPHTPSPTRGGILHAGLHLYGVFFLTKQHLHWCKVSLCPTRYHKFDCIWKFWGCHCPTLTPFRGELEIWHATVNRSMQNRTLIDAFSMFGGLCRRPRRVVDLLRRRPLTPRSPVSYDRRQPRSCPPAD